MSLHLVKQGGATALAVINLVLVGWAIWAYRRRRSIPDGYFRLLSLSVLLVGLQVSLGLWFVLQGRYLAGQHLFYGLLVATGGIGQALLRQRMVLGRLYRGKPIVYAFFALLVALTAIRSWITVRG